MMMKQSGSAVILEQFLLYSENLVYWRNNADSPEKFFLVEA